jgi:hypothetical protein
MKSYIRFGEETMKSLLNICAVVLLIATVTLACGTSANTGTKVGENTQPANISASSTPQTPDATNAPDVTSAPDVTKTPEPSATTAAPTNNQIGDIIAVGDHKISLNSVSYKGGILKANFSFINGGSADTLLSSMVSFDAKADDGTKLEAEIMNCGISLDGSVMAMDKAKGDVCWKLPATGKFKIYFLDNLFANGAIFWVLDSGSLPAIVPTPNGQLFPPIDETNAHPVGEAVELSGEKITLNSASLTGKVLKANFTIENTGTDDVTVSSLVSFTARNSAGEKLNLKFMACGSSLDGKIIAGDKLKGDLCWDTGIATEAKIYYEGGTILSMKTVTWVVKGK